jgi:hypothetical protein
MLVAAEAHEGIISESAMNANACMTLIDRESFSTHNAKDQLMARR